MSATKTEVAKPSVPEHLISGMVVLVFTPFAFMLAKELGFLSLLVAIGCLVRHFTAKAAPPKPPALPGAPLTAAQLAIHRQYVTNAIDALSRVGSFAHREQLDGIWDKSIHVIAHELDTWNTSIRNGWQGAMKHYNASVSAVDDARSALRYTLAVSEGNLAKYAINYRDFPVPKSPAAEGWHAKPITIPTTRHLNSTELATRALSQMAIGRTTGNVLLDVAMVGTGLVVTEILKSKKRRALKEVEGQLANAGAEVDGGITTIHTILRTRCLPQYEWIERVCLALGEQQAALLQAELDGSDDQARRSLATRLAMSVAEGQYLLKTTAGNG